ncbi:MAG: TolC family protein [Inhella sp.]|uniref:TolC family protein n=1 Tax=Inhella sp. TaxID=1921806 RepID=UPI0022C4815B|nr:TolC family protein [Inhella sp.]MCZ8233556.1 TolC family protein [Inhella sp.]
MKARRAHRCRLAVTLTLAMALGGCATAPPEASAPWVHAEVNRRLPPGAASTEPPAPLSDTALREALAQPLDADAAVRLALRQHPSVHARLHRLGVAEAEAWQALQWPNPGLSLGRLSQGGALSWEAGLHLDLVRLLMRPQRQRVESAKLQAERREAAAELLRWAHATRRAWVQAVAAQEAWRYQRQVMDAAEASAELARRMEAVGNFNALQRAREQTFLAEAALGLARAEQRRHQSRERLVRQLGLWGESVDALKLPDRLPPLPATPPPSAGLEARALRERLDIDAARWTLTQSQADADLVRGTRWVDALALGRNWHRGHDEPTETGWTLSLALPVFDGAGPRVARAQALQAQRLQELAALALQARSEVREADLRLQHAHDIARLHRDALLPLRQRIADEQLLRYNGMLTGVFELLADTRAQIQAVASTIDALEAYWLAQTDLDQALIGSPGASGAEPHAAPTASSSSPSHAAVTAPH